MQTTSEARAAGARGRIKSSKGPSLFCFAVRGGFNHRVSLRTTSRRRFIDPSSQLLPYVAAIHPLFKSPETSHLQVHHRFR
jgi:hypothetical protein